MTTVAVEPPTQLIRSIVGLFLTKKSFNFLIRETKRSLMNSKVSVTRISLKRYDYQFDSFTNYRYRYVFRRSASFLACNYKYRSSGYFSLYRHILVREFTSTYSLRIESRECVWLSVVSQYVRNVAYTRCSNHRRRVAVEFKTIHILHHLCRRLQERL